MTDRKRQEDATPDPVWSYRAFMKTAGRRLSPPELLIFIGGCLFIFVLWLSAYFEPDIRWLHFFQSWMYLAAIWLSVRRSRWGYFIGVSAAGLWDYVNIFVTTFF